MTQPMLIDPAPQWVPAYLEAVEEGLPVYGVPTEREKNLHLLKTDFTAWKNWMDDLSRPVSLPDGSMGERVPENRYWLVNPQEKRFLGQIQLRHRLTPFLEQAGGHVGYSVRPSERGKGYATLMLGIVLSHALALGLKDVLVSCDTQNPASARVIEKNGGQLIDITDNPFPDAEGRLRRYRIPVLRPEA